MKSSALFLTIVLTITVNSQAQTVQKTNYLKSHVIKKQNNLASKKIKKRNRLADSLTLGEKLMIVSAKVDFYGRINTSLNAAHTEYLKATDIKHKLLLTTLQTLVVNWYINKYNLDDYWENNWFGTGLQQPLNHQIRLSPRRGTSFQPIYNRWIQF